MRKSLLLIAFFTVLKLHSQGDNQPGNGLAESFIQSLKKADFSILEKYIPGVAFYRSTGKEMASRPEKELNQIRIQSRTRLKENWQQVLDKSGKNGVDLSSVDIRESLVYEIIPGKPMKGMVVVYAYKGRTYDDLSLIVSEQPGKTWLLEIPNALRVFSMQDSSLRNSTEARQVKFMADPGLKGKLEQKVQAMIVQARGDSVQAFGRQVIYKGDQETRNWKTALNMDVPEELARAESLKKEVLMAMSDCVSYTFGTLRKEKESEGQWLIQPVVCGKKKIFFAFLLVGNQLFLGDLDTDME